jgi:uncharacterized protein (DUF1697 family)
MGSPLNRYVALFRGINVGGHHKLPMKELAGLLEGLGCLNVRTYIQSGNVVLDTDTAERGALAEQITGAVERAKGFAPKVWLMTAEELRAAIEANPFPADAGKALHFFFLEQAPGAPDLAGLSELRAESESFELVDNVFYLHTPDGIGRSKLVEKLGRFIRVPMTARNGNTVAKLAQMLEDKA